MIVDLDKLNIDNILYLDGDVVFDDQKYCISDIKKLKNIHFNGQIELDEDDDMLLKGNLTGIMTILDSISLNEVDYHFSIDIDEKIEENVRKNKNSIDIIENLWQNIVLEVPLRYTEVTDYSKYSGDGWRLISEDELVHDNNPFQSLLEKEKEE